MILLITRYNLSPKWVQLILFLIFYLILFKLQIFNNDTSFVFCMKANKTAISNSDKITQLASELRNSPRVTNPNPSAWTYLGRAVPFVGDVVQRDLAHWWSETPAATIADPDKKASMLEKFVGDANSLAEEKTKLKSTNLELKNELKLKVKECMHEREEKISVQTELVAIAEEKRNLQNNFNDLETKNTIMTERIKYESEHILSLEKSNQIYVQNVQELLTTNSSNIRNLNELTQQMGNLLEEKRNLQDTISILTRQTEMLQNSVSQLNVANETVKEQLASVIKNHNSVINSLETIEHITKSTEIMTSPFHSFDFNADESKIINPIKNPFPYDPKYKLSPGKRSFSF